MALVINIFTPQCNISHQFLQVVDFVKFYGVEEAPYDKTKIFSSHIIPGMLIYPGYWYHLIIFYFI